MKVALVRLIYNYRWVKMGSLGQECTFYVCKHTVAERQKIV